MKTGASRKRKKISPRHGADYNAGGDHNAIAALHISEILMLLLIEKELLSADSVIEALEDLAEHHEIQRAEATTAKQRALHRRVHRSVERFIAQPSIFGAAPARPRGRS